MSYRELQDRALDEQETQERARSSRAEERSREDFARAAHWARLVLPGEHPQLAASAVLTLKRANRTVTASMVRERLRAEGKDSESLRRKGLGWTLESKAPGEDP